MYLERRFHKFMAFHDVPPKVRHIIGFKRFAKALDTEQHGVAKILAAEISVQGMLQIQQAYIKLMKQDMKALKASAPCRKRSKKLAWPPKTM